MPWSVLLLTFDAAISNRLTCAAFLQFDIVTFCDTTVGTMIIVFGCFVLLIMALTAMIPMTKTAMSEMHNR